MQDYFNQVSDTVNSLLRGDEVSNVSFQAEDSDFVRFNKSEVRQAGRVTQRAMSLDLIEGKKHASGRVSLSGDPEIDKPRIEKLVRDLREQRSFLPEDPYLLYSTEVNSTERVMENRLPDGAQAIADIRKAGEGRDLVGILASGGIHAGFASSLGQRNWYSNYSYNLDWSFYHQKDKAVKTGYAGFEWKPDEFSRKVGWAKDQLDVLRHDPKTIKPGRYRVYMAPSALNDIVGILSWGGFGLKSLKTKQSSLLRLARGDEQMSPSLTVAENTKEGVAPNFQGQGYLKPDSLNTMLPTRLPPRRCV